MSETYDLVSADELKQIVERKKVMLGYDHGRLIGFVGEHLEGSMGLLYVFHKFRRKGYGAALEKSMIAKTLEEGYIPFGQVEKNNHASMQLQKKIGMPIVNGKSSISGYSGKAVKPIALRMIYEMTGNPILHKAGIEKHMDKLLHFFL